MSTDMNRRALNGPAMGARWSAVFYAKGSFDTTSLATELQAAVDEVERQMSSWRPDSELQRLNRAPVGVWLDVPLELMHVLQAALAVSELSDGAFDIGVGDLVKVRGLGAGSRIPDLDQIGRLAGRLSFPPPQTLLLDPAARKVRKLAPLTLDLSGIAKGFGVDELARVVAAAGVSSWLVGVDGEMRAAGRKLVGTPRTVGHERPQRDARALMGVIGLDEASVATSGNYRHIVRSTAEGTLIRLTLAAARRFKTISHRSRCWRRRRCKPTPGPPR
jgi:thiamine biosynthesis lipoprotein